MPNKATHHPLTKHQSGDGRYVYRGVTIERHDRERGYWGHWTAHVGSIMHGTHKRLASDTRANLLLLIDRTLDTPAESVSA